jgi:rubrerythrin
MRDATAANLRSAFGGESQAHMRYKIWGKKAERDGFENIARMFGAISSAEQIHATNHFRALARVEGDFLVPSMAVFGLGSTSANLQGGIDGETYEVEEMYPAFLEVAKSQELQPAVQSFTYALAAEKTHAEFFKRGKAAAEDGQDLELGAVNVCGVCGYTVEGEPPDKCPICDVSSEQFNCFE